MYFSFHFHPNAFLLFYELFPSLYKKNILSKISIYINGFKIKQDIFLFMVCNPNIII